MVRPFSKARNHDRTTEKQGKREMGREKNKRQKNKSNTETKFQNENVKWG